MKIVHVCAFAGVCDGWSYQENVMSKYHRIMGHDVTIITSQRNRGKDGKLEIKSEQEYFNDDGVKMIRLPYFISQNVKYFRRLVGFKKVLQNETPDIIFIHNLQFFNVGDIISYVNSCDRNINIYVDSHVDFSNSASNFASREILHKIIWKHQAHRLLPYVKKFYGVLPARVDFLSNIYGLPTDKVELLVMGADDIVMKENCTNAILASVRANNGIKNDDFLIVTGGKIDSYKWETLNLMKAVIGLKSDKVKLLIFGSVSAELKDEFNKLCADPRIIYIGWIDSKESYKYFGAADLVIFPGRHSVFWEQAAAQAKPMICKYWDGTTHIDGNGNVVFLKKDSIEELTGIIGDLMESPEKLNVMREVAEQNSSRFLYSEIAAKGIELDAK